MTHDKNGVLIQCGDVVLIENAYFKNDNGYWFVAQDGTNPAYSSSGLTMLKIGKRGKLSTAKYNLTFWPLVSFCSDRNKRYESDVHNKKNATIEVVDNIDKSDIICYFKKKINEDEEMIKYNEWHYILADNELIRKEIAYWNKGLNHVQN